MSEEEKVEMGVIYTEDLLTGDIWLRKLRERENNSKVDEVVDKLNSLEKDLKAEDDLNFVDLIKSYSTYVDDYDVDIVKAGWQLGVKRYAKLWKIAGLVGYREWPEYSGFSREQSLDINNFLWDMAFVKKKFGLDELVEELVKEFKMSREQAEVIVRTEFANIFNKVREWGYVETTDVKKYVWVVKDDACELCREVLKRAGKGVSIKRLKRIIKDVGGEYAREWSVHPNCRCSFTRKHGVRKGWEKV